MWFFKKAKLEIIFIAACLIALSGCAMMLGNGWQYNYKKGVKAVEHGDYRNGRYYLENSIAKYEADEGTRQQRLEDPDYQPYLYLAYAASQMGDLNGVVNYYQKIQSHRFEGRKKDMFEKVKAQIDNYINQQAQTEYLHREPNWFYIYNRLRYMESSLELCSRLEHALIFARACLRLPGKFHVASTIAGKLFLECPKDEPAQTLQLIHLLNLTNKHQEAYSLGFAGLQDMTFLLKCLPDTIMLIEDLCYAATMMDRFQMVSDLSRSIIDCPENKGLLDLYFALDAYYGLDHKGMVQALIDTEAKGLFELGTRIRFPLEHAQVICRLIKRYLGTKNAKLFIQGLQIELDYRSAERFKGELYYELGEFVEAAVHLNNSLDPKYITMADRDTLLKIGMSNFKLRLYEKAKNILETVIELESSADTDYGAGYYWLGLSLYKLGQNYHALQMLAKSRDLGFYAYNPQIYYWLGRINYIYGNYDEAYQSLHYYLNHPLLNDPIPDAITIYQQAQRLKESILKPFKPMDRKRIISHRIHDWERNRYPRLRSITGHSQILLLYFWHPGDPLCQRTLKNVIDFTNRYSELDMQVIYLVPEIVKQRLQQLKDQLGIKCYIDREFTLLKGIVQGEVLPYSVLITDQGEVIKGFPGHFDWRNNGILEILDTRL